MVLKKSKFGGNTGNTLRKGGHKISPTAAYISKDCYTSQLAANSKTYKFNWMKNDINSKKSKNSLNDCTNVTYSLNKRKMWDICKEMQKDVLAESERNRINAKPENDVRVAIIDNVSFINSVDRNENRCTKSWDAALDISKEFKESIDTTYTINRAVNYNSSIYHKGWTDFDKNHKKTMRKRIHEKIVTCVEDENHILDEENDVDFLCDAKPFVPSNFCLDMFIVEKKKKKRKFSNHSAKSVGTSHCLYNKKENVLTIDYPGMPTTNFTNLQENTVKTENVEEEKDPLALLFNDAHLFKEFESLVNNKHINSLALKKRFDVQYVEGISSPRQFVIFNKNFSYDEIIMSVKFLKLNPCTPEKLSAVHIKLFNVSKGLIQFLDDISQQKILDFELLLDICFPRYYDVVKISSSRAITEHDSLQKYIKSFAELKSMNDICQVVLVDYITTQESVFSEQDLVSDSKCLVCFTDETTTSLKKCGHQVCESCWSRYIDTKFMSGCYEISCPFTTCINKLDIVFILTFIGCDFAMIYIKKCCELYVQKNEQIKFCPSASCSMVAVNKTNVYFNQIDNTTPITPLKNNTSVLCSCNQSWCFSCEEPEHWPSSCAANKMYQLEREKDYDLLFDEKGHLIETLVFCRQCPVCKSHIIKEQGCNHMICSCGQSFCWSCLKPWSKHNLDLCVPVKDQEHTFSSADMFGGSRKQNMKGRALKFGSHVNKVSGLKAKLRLTKKTSEDKKISLLITDVYKAISLLSCGYKLLENLAVGAAMCQSRHKGSRILRFIYDCSINLKVLFDRLDKSTLSEIKIGDLIKDKKKVEQSFAKFKELGLVMDKNLCI